MTQDMPGDSGLDSSPLTRTAMALMETLDELSASGRLAAGLSIGSVVIVIETSAPNHGDDVIARWDGPGGRPPSRHRIVGMLESALEHVKRQMPL